MVQQPDDCDEETCPECGVDLNKAAKRARRAAEERDDRRSGSSRHPISKVCPGCGHDTYEKRRSKAWVAFTDDRICKKCGTRYTPPTPLWAALVFIIGGFLVAVAGLGMLVLQLRSLNFGPIELGIAAVLIGMGGLSVFHGFRSLAEPGRG